MVNTGIRLQCRRHRFDSWVRKIPWRRKWQPTPVFLPRKSHWQRILAGYSPWGHKELDTTEQLTVSLILSVSQWLLSLTLLLYLRQQLRLSFHFLSPYLLPALLPVMHSHNKLSRNWEQDLWWPISELSACSPVCIQTKYSIYNNWKM